MFLILICCTISLAVGILVGYSIKTIPKHRRRGVVSKSFYVTRDGKRISVNSLVLVEGEYRVADTSKIKVISASDFTQDDEEKIKEIFTLVPTKDIRWDSDKKPSDTMSEENIIKTPMSKLVKQIEKEDIEKW